MKAIKLTVSHKSKLLKMCKKLFPEYNSIILIDKNEEDSESGIKTHISNEEFIEMSTYNVNSLFKFPGYNRNLYNKIVLESKAISATLAPDQYSWWKEEVVKKYSKKFDVIPQQTVVIHWFEFCTTILITELSKAYTPYGANSDEGMFLFKEESIIAIFLNGKHPVDYLYEQFKQIK